MTQAFRQHEKDITQPAYAARGAAGPGPSAASVKLRVDVDDLNDDASSTVGWTVNTGWTHSAANKRFNRTASGTQTLERTLPVVADETPLVVHAYVHITAGSITARYNGVDLGVMTSSGIYSFAIEYVAAGSPPPRFQFVPSTTLEGFVNGISVSGALSYQGYRLVAAGELSD